MANYTKLTNLEVTGELKAGGNVIQGGITKSDFTVTSDNATAAASTAPTAAEFKKTVDLCNELKANFNALVTKLADGTDPT